jgi:hypothetical protein
VGHPQQHPHAVVEILQTTDKSLSTADSSLGVLKAISASEAFLKYNWLMDAPVLNAAGDFRGMVVSADWRTVFQISSKAGEVVGNLAVVAALAVNIVEAKQQIESILNSNDSWDVKGAKLSTQVASISIRTVGGVAPAGVGILTSTLQGYCQLGGIASGGRFNPQACVSNLAAANTYVNTTFNKITDGNNIYGFLNVTITPHVSKWMGN